MADARTAAESEVSAMRIIGYAAIMAAGLFDGVAILLSAGMFVSGTLSRLGAEGGEVPLFAGAMIGCLAVGIVAIASRNRFRLSSWPWLAAFIPLATGAVFLVVAMAYPLSAGALCFAAGSFLLSFGCVANVALWSRMLSGESVLSVLTCTSLAFAFAALASILVFSLGISEIMAALFLFSPLVSTVACVLHARKGFKSAGDDDCLQRDGSDALSSLQSVSGFGSLWPILSGACICSVVLGFMWMGTGQENTATHMSSITRSIMAGFALTSLGLSASSLFSTDTARLGRMLLFLCPIMAVLPAIPCIVSVSPDGFIGPLFGLITGAGFAFFSVNLAWILLVDGDAMHVGGSVVALSVSLSVAALAGPFLAGQGTIMVSLLLFVCYLVALAVGAFSRLFGFREGVLPDGAGAVSDGARIDSEAEDRMEAEPAGDGIARRCEELRLSCGLSPRECEVLNLLARGRSSTYIADELFVSRETVKVHIKHIYEKLGVHSRTQLLDLFQ